MQRFILIETKEKMEIHESMITSLFSEVLHIDHTKLEPYRLWIFFSHELDFSLKDVIINLSQDTLLDVRLYESHVYEMNYNLQGCIRFIENQFDRINFNKYTYIDNHILVKHFIHDLDDQFKSFIFQKYNEDQLMKETIKIFLESNQNISHAAKSLFIHRNTLTQRLEKFYQVTGFDPKKFMDGFLIYALLITH